MAERILEYKTDSQVRTDIIQFLIESKILDCCVEKDGEKRKSQIETEDKVIKEFIDFKVSEINNLGELERETIINDMKDYSKRIDIYKQFDHYSVVDYAKGEHMFDEHDRLIKFERYTNIMVLQIGEKVSPQDFPSKKYLLTRQISPPLEAYEYVPFSKTKLTPTGRDFGLLFD
jgi:hypothetical protein